MEVPTSLQRRPSFPSHGCASYKITTHTSHKQKFSQAQTHIRTLKDLWLAYLAQVTLKLFSRCPIISATPLICWTRNTACMRSPESSVEPEKTLRTLSSHIYTFPIYIYFFFINMNKRECLGWVNRQEDRLACVAKFADARLSSRFKELFNIMIFSIYFLIVHSWSALTADTLYIESWGKWRKNCE